jgi:hypothetical protein
MVFSQRLPADRIDRQLEDGRDAWNCVERHAPSAGFPQADALWGDTNCLGDERLS